MARMHLFSWSLGLAVLFAWPGSGLTAQKESTIYNQCACFCDGPTGGGIIDISNSGGFSCGTYNSKTCNYEDSKTGGIRSGTTKYCGGFKPGGTKAMRAPAITKEPMVMSRGTEPDSPATVEEKGSAETTGEVQERAIPRQRVGAAELNCYCDKGQGTCSVTSKDGKTAVCEKGSAGTCTGTCMFPKGTVSGFTGGMTRQ